MDLPDSPYDLADGESMGPAPCYAACGRHHPCPDCPREEDDDEEAFWERADWEFERAGDR